MTSFTLLLVTLANIGIIKHNFANKLSPLRYALLERKAELNFSTLPIFHQCWWNSHE